MESDGQWYVSPIGTLGASVVELFRSLPDDANLIDTPLARWLFDGMGRQAMISSLAAASTIPPECEAVAAVGADGVPAVIADPPVSEIRACVNALFNVTYQSGSGSGSSTPPAEAVVEASVPASTAPPPEAGSGG